MTTILEKDNPILREKAEPITSLEFNTPELKALVDDMLKIMSETGAVGVAAPQIGVSKRVIVFGTMYAKYRKPDLHIPNTVLINPVLESSSEVKELGHEGCLNCGNLMGLVPRAIEIEYSGFNTEGQPIRKYASGLEARIFQHELDHLNGILFFDRVEEQDSLTTYEELQKGLINT